MFKILMNGIIGMLATVLQILVWPINAILTTALPDLSNQLTSVTTVLNSVFDCLSWAMGLIPEPIQVTLVFIFTVEIAKHSIYLGTHAVIKLWNVLQKVKFW